MLPDLPRERPTLLLRLTGRGRTLTRALSDVRALLQGEPDRELVKELLVALPPPISQDSNTKELSMQELETYEQVKALYQEREHEVATRALEQGRKEGRKAGQLQGERALLMRQLTRRFGRLPAKAVTRIEAASKEQIERWGERVLDAPSLAEVLD